MGFQLLLAYGVYFYSFRPCPVIWSDLQIDCMFHQSMFSSGACCSVSEPCFHMEKLSLSQEFTVQTSLGCLCWWALSPNLTPATWWPKQWNHPCHLVTGTVNSPQISPLTLGDQDNEHSPNLTPDTWWPRQWTLPKSHPCHLVTKTKCTHYQIAAILLSYILILLIVTDWFW